MEPYAYEPANFTHLIEARDLGWGGWGDWSVARLRYLPILGYAVRGADEVLSGVGCVVWLGTPTRGKAVGCFAITEEFRATKYSRWVHRRAIEVLRLAHEAAPVIYATPDPEIVQSREFLTRLGFVETGGEEWVHGVRNSVSSSGGVVHSLERDGDPECGQRGRGGNLDAQRGDCR